MGAILGRKKKVVDDEDGEDVPLDYVQSSPAWEREPVAKQVRAILEALEAPPVDDQTRVTLQRYLYRRQKFGNLFRDEWGNDGRGFVTLLVRTIIESEGNQNALIDPVVRAVAASMRPIWVRRGLEWIAAFDRISMVEMLSRLRELHIFDASQLQHFFEVSIQRQLWRIFGPDVAPEPVKIKPPPKKPPRAATRVPAIERKIELGKQFIRLRSGAKSNNEFGRLRRKLGVEPVAAQEAVRVARVYGERPEIYRSGLADSSEMEDEAGLALDALADTILDEVERVKDERTRLWHVARQSAGDANAES